MARITATVTLGCSVNRIIITRINIDIYGTCHIHTTYACAGTAPYTLANVWVR